jgi:phosphoribosylformimino-5-aminoimidazole carboxamide ribonucleotide (ProFAR) isomerase
MPIARAGRDAHSELVAQDAKKAEGDVGVGGGIRDHHLGAQIPFQSEHKIKNVVAVAHGTTNDGAAQPRVAVVDGVECRNGDNKAQSIGARYQVATLHRA